MTLASLRLLQLCSANLPTGAYAFSLGLETATEEGWVTNRDQAQNWLEVQLRYSVGGSDLPILLRSLKALKNNDVEALLHWNRMALTLRETKELRLTDSATGEALMRVLKGLENGYLDNALASETEISFVTAFAFAAHQWAISSDDVCIGYAWSWLENQVAAATKLVPLGQTQSQQLLEILQPNILSALECAQSCADCDIGESLPMLSVASCWHEHQYSRLFRS
jgi:urease accessory protein